MVRTSCIIMPSTMGLRLRAPPEQAKKLDVLTFLFVIVLMNRKVCEHENVTKVFAHGNGFGIG